MEKNNYPTYWVTDPQMELSDHQRKGNHVEGPGYIMDTILTIPQSNVIHNISQHHIILRIDSVGIRVDRAEIGKATSNELLVDLPLELMLWQNAKVVDHFIQYV